MLVGVAAAVGIGLAVSHADAAEPDPPFVDPDPDFDSPDDSGVVPEPAKPPVPKPSTGNGSGAGTGAPVPPAGPPAASGEGGSASGAPPILGPARPDLLPPELQNIDLSGNEQVLFTGIHTIPGGNEVHPFYTWVVKNGLNGMDMDLFVSVENPLDWISTFVHPDPPGSSPPSHMIIYKMSQLQPMKDWMVVNIAGLNVSRG